MRIDTIFYLTGIYSLLSATSFLVLTKYAIISYLQGHTKSVINKIVNCQLCLCFWLCLFFTIIGIIFDQPVESIICPFAGASLTRAIINL